MKKNTIDLTPAKDLYHEKDGQVEAIIKRYQKTEAAIGGGLSDVVWIIFETQNGAQLQKRYELKKDKMFHLLYLVRAALKEVPDQLDFDDLIGCKVMLKIVNESVFSNIRGVYSVAEEEDDELSDDLESDADFDDDTDDDTEEDDDDEDEDEIPLPSHRRRRKLIGSW